MSVDGAWKITINTPMGPQEVTADITTNGDTFSGKTQGPLGSNEVNGKIAGNSLTWNMDITSPLPMTLEFQAEVAGDKMTGTVKLGMFGQAALSGERV